MKYLVDTHTWIWWLFDPARIPGPVKTALLDGSSHCYFSSASAWELTIKVQLGKLRLPLQLHETLGQLESQKIAWLDISQAHCLRFESLPLHHPDPFDRMLAAQSLAENLTLISKDGSFDSYGVTRLWQ